MKKVLIVDDHPVMRYGLSTVIRTESDLRVCGEASTAVEAIAAIIAQKPDLVLLDLSLPDRSGLDLLKDIVARHEGVAVLVVSMHDESIYAERVLRAGARGYIMKEVAPDKLIEAIRTVLGGRIFVSEEMSATILESVSGSQSGNAATPLERLTDRELEVLRLIGQGRGTREVGEQLCISVRTIDAHRAHIKEKLGLKDGNALVRFAVRWVESGRIE